MSDITQRVSQPATEARYAPSRLTGFGDKGAEEYHNAVKTYVIALEQVSRASAQNRQSEVVSPIDVQTAADSLRSTSPNKRAVHFSEIGTLLIGAALGYLGSVVYGSSYTFVNALLIFVPLVVGGILTAYGWGHG